VPEGIFSKVRVRNKSRAIQAVGSREAIFSPEIASRLIIIFGQIQSTVQAKGLDDLTQREKDILKFIGRGSSNAEIAKHLSLSMKTVSNYVSNIFNKLQVADRVQAAIRARETGLTQSSLWDEKAKD
jgi:DNA-binding NarL/FixJ family response regulator